jgi:hypothetical protein
VRAEKEKQLESFRGKVQVHADAERDRAWKHKYRMVQFFGPCFFRLNLSLF